MSLAEALHNHGMFQLVIKRLSSLSLIFFLFGCEYFSPDSPYFGTYQGFDDNFRPCRVILSYKLPMPSCPMVSFEIVDNEGESGSKDICFREKHFEAYSAGDDEIAFGETLSVKLKESTENEPHLDAVTFNDASLKCFKLEKID